MKNNPRICIGKTERKLNECNLLGPGPDKYSVHTKMSEKKYSSSERNAKGVKFGNGVKERKDFI